MKSSLIEQIEAARRVSTPLVAIETTDPAATLRALVDGLPNGGKDGPPPIVQWDIAAGLRPLNPAGDKALAKMTTEGGDMTRGNPQAAMEAAAKLPERGILAIHAAGRWLDAQTVQAIWNLRDQFKVDERTLLLIGQSIELPPELAGDVLTFEEPLPDAGALAAIVRYLYETTDGVDEPAAATVDRAVEALAGLSAFSAEQVAAMSLGRSGLDIDACWEQKRKLIDRTPALSVCRDVETFADVGGVAVIKDFLRRIMHGRRRPRAVVFVDEIEKQLAGIGGDTSGVSQDQLGTLLTYMQDHGSAGCIFVGPPGSAKSMVAKAAGHAGGVPTIQLDLGAAKGSLVGQSEQQLRSALKVISAVSSDSALWVATCNSINALPPELRRRFTLGTYFFDLPDPADRAAIWKIHRERFGIDKRQTLPTDELWTGAEIRQCCDLADRLDVDLVSAAAYVVPVAISAADQLEKLRSLAAERFLSASSPGTYRRTATTTTKSPRRKVTT